ncbi:MAG: HupE/UreJ family protein [Thiohalomonadaceae bacterium]
MIARKAMTASRAAALALLLSPTLALAHTGHYDGGGLMQGVMHPLAGLDHLLAMVAVGLWAAYAGGRALWALPAAFVGMMLAGAMLGFAGIALPLMEPLILASVVVLGLLVAFNVRMPLMPGMALIALFGIFHGQAHALEMSAGAGAVAYAAGFAGTTALLHASGIALGRWLLAGRGARLIGLGMASAGVFMAVA